jgi:hypothetical protein
LIDDHGLRGLFDVAVDHPNRLAAHLLPAARARGWDDAQLADYLGCRPEGLPRLLLARLSAPCGSSEWERTLTTLASTHGIQRMRLEVLLRVAGGAECRD